MKPFTIEVHHRNGEYHWVAFACPYAVGKAFRGSALTPQEAFARACDAIQACPEVVGA